MTISFLQLVDLFKASLGGIVAALVISPLAIWIARRARILDIPGSASHKQHAQPTPLAGGFVLVLGTIVLLTVFRLWHAPYLGLVGAAAIVFLFGLWDDAKPGGLTAWQKLIGQILASIVLIATGTSVKFLKSLPIDFLGPAFINVLNWGVTVFWLVGITNAINLVDSMDGLASGIAGIAFAFFMGMALVAQQTTLALFSAIFLGMCIGMYVFNINPARLFLGDSGAQTLGFILAAVGIIYTPNNLPQGSSWFVPIMVLGVPIFDTTLVFFSRLVHRQPVFHADRAHTYHRLVAMGMASSRAVFTIHMTALVLNFLAFIVLSFPPLAATLTFGAVVLVGVILLIFFVRKNPTAVS